MRRLFLKIFLWYWLATSILGLVLYVAIWTTSDQQGPLWLRDVGNLLAIHGLAAVEAFEREGRQGLAAYLERSEADESMRTFVFDDAGAEVSGRTPPPPVVEMAATARQSLRAEFGLGMPSMVVARPIAAPSGRTFVVAARFTGGRRGPPLTTGPMVARALAVLAAAGIVCYGLAWYLTRRIERLRAATRTLARGDLAVRVGESLGAGRDELTELGRDVDDMAERLEALLASERRLLQDLSHELRSPLARLVVALELVRQRGDADASAELDRIELETQRLDELIGRILTLTRLDTTPADAAEHSDIDFTGLVSDVAADAEYEAAGAGRGVSVEATVPCVVRGDEALVRSAIENVVRNAIRYTAEGTTVEVALRVEPAASGNERTAVVTVRDHGPGVPDDALERLFRPFYRVDDGRARQSGGTGLGLAIAERAVRMHGGTARASNVPDGGLVIELRIPAERES